MQSAISGAALAAILAGGLAAVPACAQEAAAPAARPPILPMRYDEDWRPLADERLRTQPLDALKHLPLGVEGWVTLGGEFRLRGERADPEAGGFGNGAELYYLRGRAYLHADVHANESLRVFVQARTGWVWGEGRGLGPVQDNDLDLNQAFVDVAARAGGGQLTIRAGRQEMLFGSGRLVGPRDGPNIRLSFDGVRAIWKDASGWRADGFYAPPVLPESGSFDDEASENFKFWGAYLTGPVPGAPGVGADLYYLGLDRERSAFGQGIADQTRHTIGARLFGRRGRWDWDLEAAYQFGTFGDADISAYTFANDIGYTFAAPWSPRLGLRLDLASGDGDLSNGTLGTFEVPFPKLPYLTEANFAGPANIIDIHPTLQVKPARAFTLSLDYIALLKHRREDAFYLPPLRPVPGTVGTGRFAAHVVQGGLVWTPRPQFSLEFAYARAFVSDGLQAAGAEDSDFFLLATTARF